ncbi:isopentenyl-diphosphate Delta-isomerase [Deinococcus carri]|uniref:Isopentenyl-diphosphate Delta-isomerase n=1 Tax=Deinococcus carri TaxID=1211323 RepID=A0ABP9WCT6_9DEIO
MADSGCFPLWSRGENVDPLTLLLPPELTARLLAWADALDSTLNRADPASPLPMRAAFLRDAESEWDSFEREGHTLWRALRAARPDLHVTYHSVLLERAVDPDTDELLDLLNDAGDVIGVLWRSEAEGVRHKRGVTAFLRDGAGRLFIPRRAAHKTRWPGALDFSVGGLVLAGETFNEAFAREAREELNLNVEALGWQVTANLDPLTTDLRCFTRVYEVPFEGTPDLNPEDFSGGEWLTPGEVLGRAGTGEPVNGDLVEVVRRVYGKQ